MPEIIRARRVPSRGRRPFTGRPGRICEEKGCNTVLSRYNSRDVCYQHTPTRFPQVRGIVKKL